MNTARIPFRALAVLLALILLAVALTLAGCSTTRHQKPGRSLQSLPPSMPMQEMVQPENPQGESRQKAERTTTAVDPQTGIITVTTDRAETVIGGSQDLAKIVREKVGADHLRNMLAAVVLALAAWLLRREWPLLATGLAFGAVVVAFFGITYALGFGGFGAGVVLAYYASRRSISPL